MGGDKQVPGIEIGEELNPILIGLGVKELSVAIPSVPTIKERVRSLSHEECREIAVGCLEAADGAEVRRILEGA